VSPTTEVEVDEVITRERVPLPASFGLTDQMRFDLRVYDYSYPEGYAYDPENPGAGLNPVSDYTVYVPAGLAGNNTNLSHLVDDINLSISSETPDVWAIEEDGFIIFESTYAFDIEYKSEYETLIGFGELSYENEIEANRSSNDGVLPEDVTVVLWVNLGTQKIVGEVTITADTTAGNDDENMIMDLLLDLQTEVNGASYVNLSGDPYGDGFLDGEEHDENFADDPVRAVQH